MILQEKTPSHKWWDEALTLVEGCSHVSSGCENCWLAAMESRFHPTGKFSNNYGGWSGRVKFHEDRLKKPGRTKKPTVFALWSDLGHPGVTLERPIYKFLNMTSENERHTFIVLTKRPENFTGVKFPENVIYGISAENQTEYDRRKPDLLKVSAGHRALSLEPLLGDIRLGDLTGIDWVIAGAESKGNSPGRDCLNWAIAEIVDQCSEQNVPVFVKQIQQCGRLIKDISQFPNVLKRRDLPGGDND